MVSAVALRRWSWVHKWSSLVCTVFMLLLCLTGLPLIFHHDIEHLLGTGVEAPELPINTPRASLDVVMQTAQARYPQLGGMFASQEEDDDRVWFVTLSRTPTDEVGMKQVAVDTRTRWLDLHNLLGIVTLVWALLDVATIVVLGSGLYLWLQRRQPKTVAVSGHTT